MDLITVLRVVISLAVVFGALWFFQRRMTKRGGARGRKQAPLTVLGRVNLGGKASAVMVETSGTRLVLGVTEHGVSVLTSEPLVKTDPPLVDAAVTARSTREAAPTLRAVEWDADTESIRVPSAEELAADWAARAAKPTEAAPVSPTRHRVTFIRDAAGNPASFAGVREGFERIRGAISR